MTNHYLQEQNENYKLQCIPRDVNVNNWSFNILICTRRAQLDWVRSEHRKREHGSVRVCTKHCDFGEFCMPRIFFVTFRPLPTAIDHFLYIGNTLVRAKYVETASPFMCIHFLAVNSTGIYSSLERWTNNGLSRVLCVLCLIFTVKTTF